MKIFFFNRKKYDYMQASLTEGLIDLGHDVVGYFMANYCHSSHELKNWEDLSGYDLVIFGESQVKYLKRLGGFRSSFPGRVVCLDGADDAKIRFKGYLYADFYFKRELNKLAFESSFLDGMIYPISFAIEKRYLFERKFVAQQDLDFVCMMNLSTNSKRKNIHQFLKQYFLSTRFNTYIGVTGERAYGSEPHPLDTPIYYSKLGGSRVALSMHGAGQDCARYWEILASGALLISQKITNKVVDLPKDGEHCYYFDSILQLEKILDFVFSNPDNVKTVAERGRKFSLLHHTTQARAAYFLNKLMSRRMNAVHKMIGFMKIACYNVIVFLQSKRTAAI